MGLPARLLAADEHEVLQVRPHGKVLGPPAVLLVVLAGLTGAGAAVVPEDYRPLAQVAVVGLGGLGVWAWSAVPFLRWLSRTYVLTDRRLVARRGLLLRTGRDLPLGRIRDVTLRRSLTDRALGCGTLHLALADGGVVELRDVPDAEGLRLVLGELLFLAPPGSTAVLPLGPGQTAGVRAAPVNTKRR